MPRSHQVNAHAAAALFLVALALCCAAARAAERDSIHLRFEVYGGPALHFLTLRVTVDQSASSYAITVMAETRGLADLFVDLRSQLAVRGRISADALFPEAMRAETQRGGVVLHTRIDYAADGTVTAEATPPPSRPVTPVAPAQMRGTVDQLTAYLVLARSLARYGSCRLALAVFDGRRRYDLRFSDLAPEALAGFAGPAKVCRMSRRRIAGFPVDREGNAMTDQGRLWFAHLLPGDLMVPLRMEFDSEWGTFTAELVELRGRGVELRGRGVELRFAE
jgi:hypothetical protein